MVATFDGIGECAESTGRCWCVTQNVSRDHQATALPATTSRRHCSTLAIISSGCGAVE